MGIHSEWPRVWCGEGEGAEFKVDAVPVQTVFIDGQIMLMKSQARLCVCALLPPALVHLSSQCSQCTQPPVRA
tara:strand:+ start:6038 stop:6256 length:219 start_codon:yes stop_codon:yes gene_type:complete